MTLYVLTGTVTDSDGIRSDVHEATLRTTLIISTLSFYLDKENFTSTDLVLTRMFSNGVVSTTYICEKFDMLQLAPTEPPTPPTIGSW